MPPLWCGSSLQLATDYQPFPESGRTVPEIDDDSIRELIVSSYRLIYRIHEETVTIAAVVHNRQSFEAGVGRIRDRGA